MLFVYIAIVKISGNIGGFNLPSDAVDSLLDLQRDLLAQASKCKEGAEPQLLPALAFNADLPWRPKDLKEADPESQAPEMADPGTTRPGRKETAPESQSSNNPEVAARSLINS
jgi:hypothetical protein